MAKTSAPVVAVVVAQLLMVAGCGVLGSTGASAGTAPSLPSPSQFEQALYAHTNDLRVSQGLSELVWNECAARLARERALDTLDQAMLEHAPLRAQCGEHDYAGENLSRSPLEPEGVMDLWEASPLHRQNLVSPYFEVLGVGCVAYAFADPARSARPGEAVGGMACSQIFEGTGP